jgi:hypothetical protein
LGKMEKKIIFKILTKKPVIAKKNFNDFT